MKLNEKILYYRKAAKLSQEELAERVGVSRQAVSKWELGDATPEVEKLLALARAFGVTTDELLSQTDPAAKEEPPAESAAPSAAAPNVLAAEDGLDRAAGFLGKLIRRYGWLAGVYVALSGLGVTLVGALARWGFGAMFSASAQMMGSMGGFGSMGGVTFSPGTSPELQQAILEELGIAASSPLGGMQDFFLGFANVILFLGIITMAAGVILAAVLHRRGRNP